MIQLLVVLAFAGAEVRVIPAGHDDDFANALGRGKTLSGGCTWQGANIEPKLITAKYACPTGEVTIRFDVSLDAGFTSTDSSPLAVEVIAALDALSVRLESTVVIREGPPLGLRELIPRGAWALLLLALIAVLVESRRHLTRAALIDATFVFVVALVLRLLVPWGPLDFAEPERLPSLLGRFQLLSAWSSASTFFDGLLFLGFTPLTAYRFAGPVLGAITCVVALGLARRLGVTRIASVLAALALATWPVHVRFSASGNVSLFAALLWLSVLCVVMSTSKPTRSEWLVLIPLIVLCVHARPEGRFVVLVVAPWWWFSEAPRSWKAAFAAVVGLALIPYARENLIPAAGSSIQVIDGIRALAPTLFSSGVTPMVTLLLGVVGLVLLTLTVRQRWQLALTVLAILGSAIVFGSEDNPVWGHWRYLVPLIPLLAIGFGRALESLPSRPRLVFGIAVALVLSPFVTARRGLFGAMDLQEEFQFVLRTTKDVAGERLVLLDGADEQKTRGFMHFELVSALAVSLAGSRWATIEQNEPVGDAVLYQGLTRRLRERHTLREERIGPLIRTERVRVAPLGRVMDSQCQGPELECEVELSWFAVKQ